MYIIFILFVVIQQCIHKLIKETLKHNVGPKWDCTPLHYYITKMKIKLSEKKNNHLKI